MDPVDLHYVLRHHPKFGVIRKVCDKLREQSWRQRRGLTQRGAARQDPKLARNFLAFLESRGLVESQKHRPDLVQCTVEGWEICGRFCDKLEVPSEFDEFLTTELLQKVASDVT